MSETTRRAVLAGGAGLSVAAVISACGGAGSGGGTNGGGTNGGTNGSGDSGGAKSGVLGAKSSVPVGGGVVYPDQQVVVTQPAAGDFKGFSAVCTHQGCIVKDVSGGRINCACHGSQYSAKDGSVVTGPAQQSLAAKAVRVDGDNLVLG